MHCPHPEPRSSRPTNVLRPLGRQPSFYVGALDVLCSRRASSVGGWESRPKHGEFCCRRRGSFAFEMPKSLLGNLTGVGAIYRESAGWSQSFACLGVMDRRNWGKLAEESLDVFLHAIAE